MTMNANLFFYLVIALLITSCASKRDDAEGHQHGTSTDIGVWQDMDDFHMIMAETFHPYKDSSNLEPAKRRATELMNAANRWAAAPLPDRVNSDAVRSALEQLKSEAAVLAESVQSEDDHVIASHLTRLHDTFHAIQEEWYRQD